MYVPERFCQHHGTAVFIYLLQHLLVGYQQLGVSILHHEIQALGRVAGVKGLVGAAGFKHAQGGEHHPFAATYED